MGARRSSHVRVHSGKFCSEESFVRARGLTIQAIGRGSELPVWYADKRVEGEMTFENLHAEVAPC